MSYEAPSKLDGERGILAEFRKLAEELRAFAAGRSNVRALRPGVITAQPGEITRAQANQTVLLPAAKAAQGAGATVLVESQPVTIRTSDRSTINGAASLTITTLGAVECRSTGAAWWTGASGGAAGGGSATPPWSKVLDAGATTSGHTPTVGSGDALHFASGATGITAAENLTVDATYQMVVDVGATLDLTTGGFFNATCGFGISFAALGSTQSYTSYGHGTLRSTAGDARLTSDAAEVALSAGTFVSVNNFLRFTEQAASTPSMSAGQALFWVKDNAPNTPRFTDDTNADFDIPLGIGSTSITWDAATRTFQRAALTGAVVAGQNINATTFGAIANDHMIAFRGDPDAAATAASATPIPNLHTSHVAIHAKFHGFVSNALPLDGFALGGAMTWASLTAHGSEQVGGVRCTVPLGGSGYAHFGALPTTPAFDPATLRGFRTIVRLNTANPGADYDFGLGFGDDLSDVAVGGDTGLGTNSIFFRVTNAALWNRSRQASGTASGNNSGTAVVAGNVYVLEAYRTGGTTWEFFVNGTSEAAGSSTNIPTAALNFGWAINDDGGGATDFTVDIFQVDIFTDSLGDRHT